MGYFSDLNLEIRGQVHIDRTYPSRCETLSWFMEDLTLALEARGVSVEALAQSAKNGLIDYYNPRSRYHYYHMADILELPLMAEDNLELPITTFSINDLIMAVGEVAFLLKKARRDEWMMSIEVIQGNRRNYEREYIKLSA